MSALKKGGFNMSLLKRKITIYEGTIKKVFADGVVLNKEGIKPTIKNEVVTDKALFYPSIFKYALVEDGSILPTDEEAYDYMNRVVQLRSDSIYEVLANPTVSQEEKQTYLEQLAKDSSCIYFAGIHKDSEKTISKKEFKESQKELKKRK